MKLLGLSLTDYTLKEALRHTQEFINTSRLNTVCLVDNDLTLMASNDVQLLSAIEKMDLLVLQDSTLLKAGGIMTKSREREIAEHQYMRQLLSVFAKNKSRIFLIADDQKSLVSMRTDLLKISPRLTFFGSAEYAPPYDSNENIANTINAANPDVIISAVSSPAQEYLITDCKSMVNCHIWIALRSKTLPETVKYCQGRISIFSRLLSHLKNRSFYKAITRYENKD